MKVVAAVEVDKHACRTYARNFKDRGAPKLYQSDIGKLKPETLIADCFPTGLECDLVLGGPPCQGFSVHRINDAGRDDPRNGLIHRYFSFVSALKPRAFLMENVPGLLWERHELPLKRFYSEASRAGYKVMPPVVLDARDFGLPQRRKRVFILGIRNGIVLPEKWAPAPTHGSFAKANAEGLRPWVPCKEVFKAAQPGDPNNIHMSHSPELVEVFEATPANGGSRSESGRTLRCHEGYNGHKDVYGRIDPAKPAPTMTTACINPSKGRFLHPVQHHGITLRHAARIQTFPDDFVFEGGLMAGGIQVGNAVPVRLGEIVLRQLAALLQSDRISSASHAVKLSLLSAAE